MTDQTQPMIPTQETPPEDPIKDDDEQKYWLQHMSTLCRRDDQMAEVFSFVRRDRQLADEIERVKQVLSSWIRHLEAKREALHYHLGPAIQSLVRHLLTGRKERSIHTPYGVIGFRKQPARIVVVDEQALVEAWRDGQVPAPCVKQTVTEQPVLAEINKLYQSFGELLPGCELKPEEDRFYVR